MIQHAELVDALDYEPTVGVFRWKKQLSPYAAVGSVAGSVSHDGYRTIYIHRVRYQAARLAWFYVTGRWPAQEIDHKNRINNDDRFENLREATATQNTRNKGVYRNNKSGFKGVFERKPGQFRAMIRIDKRLRQLGTFGDAEAAARAYDAAARSHFGEFAVLNLP